MTSFDTTVDLQFLREETTVTRASQMTEWDFEPEVVQQNQQISKREWQIRTSTILKTVTSAALGLLNSLRPGIVAS